MKPWRGAEKKGGDGSNVDDTLEEHVFPP